MKCCGQARAAISDGASAASDRAARSQAAFGQATARPNAMAWTNPVYYAPASLRYLQSAPVWVRGPATGRQYQFSGAEPVQIVDPRDAPALVRTGLFSFAERQGGGGAV